MPNQFLSQKYMKKTPKTEVNSMYLMWNYTPYNYNLKLRIVYFGSLRSSSSDVLASPDTSDDSFKPVEKIPCGSFHVWRKISLGFLLYVVCVARLKDLSKAFLFIVYVRNLILFLLGLMASCLHRWSS